MKFSTRHLAIPLVLICLVAVPQLAEAADFFETVHEVGVNVYGGASGDLAGTVGRIIKALLSIVGALLLVIIIYAGFLWMTAGGNTTQVEKAKAWITNSVIGLVIILGAYGISSFVVEALEGATSGSAP